MSSGQRLTAIPFGPATTHWLISPKSIKQTSDGDFIIAGSHLFEVWYTRPGLDRIDAVGDTIWTRTYEFWPSHSFIGAYPRESGDFLCFLWSWQEDDLVATVGANGDTISTRCIDLGEGFRPRIEPLADGGFVSLSDDYSPSGDTLYIWLVRMNQLAEPLWRQTYSFENDPYSGGLDVSAVAQAQDGGFVCAGGKWFYDHMSGDTADIFLMKTEPEDISRASGRAPVPSQFSLRCFPNPFNPQTTISLSLATRTDVRLTIYDIQGRAVRVLTQGILDPGEHLLSFDGRDLPSGIYFARLRANGITATQKLVLLK